MYKIVFVFVVQESLAVAPAPEPAAEPAPVPAAEPAPEPSAEPVPPLSLSTYSLIANKDGQRRADHTRKTISPSLLYPSRYAKGDCHSSITLLGGREDKC